MQPVLRIKNLHQYFERGTVNENHVLRGINLSLARRICHDYRWKRCGQIYLAK